MQASKELLADAFNSLAGALASVERRPYLDLFASYYPPDAPRIADAGVSNMASHLGSRIAPGELVSVYGDHLGPREGAWGRFDAQGRVRTELSGVSVWFNGIPAPILYASSQRIDAVTPAGLGGAGKASIEVAYEGKKSAPLSVDLGPSAPGLFTVSGNGRGYAVAVNGDGTLNSEQRPARKGSWITLFGTGLGLLETGLTDGAGVHDARPHPGHGIRIRIDGIDSQVSYAGGSPGTIAGLWQLNLRVPDEVSSGMKPIQVEVDGNRGRETVYLQIQ